MGKKIKSKQRLDKFYHFAKEQGYRSRAAYKLIQMNKKYSFLNTSNVLIDLCAAPGGWLQVADQFMPLSSIKLGFDLDPIKSIPHCKTFMEDITKPNCLALIKRELHNQKADVVLHDGAPNVGANWSKDAYGQNELVLHSLKLATQVLKQGATFVTKVFRSNDYNSLVWVLNKFFEKVEATKPEASRMTSAEIYIVCLRYLAPNYIDPNLFDAKCVFKDTEADNAFETKNQEVTSLSKVLEQRRWRGGYDDNAPQSLFKRASITDFLKSDNPFPIFLDNNEMTVSEEEREQLLGLVKLPDGFEENIKDLKVLGKRELAGLLKWRGKVKMALMKKERGNKEKEAVEEKDIEEEIEEKSVHQEEELEEAIEVAEHQEIQKKRKIKEKKEKQYVKYAKNYGDEADNDLYDNDDDELFDIFKHNSLNKAGYVNLEEQETEVKPERFNRKMGLKAMDLNIEQMYEQKNNRMSLNKAKKKSAFLPEKAIKKSSKLPQPKQFELETEQTEEIPVEKQTISNKEETITKLMKKKWFDKPIFQDLLLPNSSNSFKNPLNAPNPEPNPDEDEDIPKKPLAKAKKQSQNPLDSEEEADKYVIKVPLSEMEKRRRRLKRQRQKDSRKEVDKEGEFEVVSPTNHRFEDYDIDSAAETLALAKRMLRKKDREAIIDSTYSKYAFEDQDEAPKWFREDELAHNHLILPITKEEFQAEKERLYSINNRSSKKVMEAKIRNFKRAEKKFKKTKQKAEVIFEQEGISEGIKARQIRKLYKKDADGLKKKKKYVVGRKGSAGPGKNSRSMKFVDKRLRKDTKRERDNSKKKGPGVQRRIKKFKGQSKYNRRRK